MTYFMVAWLGWACPGGFLSGLVPAAARPVVCAPSVQIERLDPAQRAAAYARVRAQGPTAKIYRCDARRCREIQVHWRTEATFEE